MQDSKFRSDDDGGPLIDLLWLKKIEQGIAQDTGKFKRAVTANGKLVLATDTGHVIRVDLKSEESSSVMVSNRLGGGIHNVFVDPLGVHVLISFVSGDNFYLNASQERPVPLPKMKGCVVAEPFRSRKTWTPLCVTRKRPTSRRSSW